MRVQFRWPVGMPLCRSLGQGLWEVRSDLPSQRIARVLFCVVGERIVALHGFIKKTQKTPHRLTSALARKRKREFERVRRVIMAKQTRTPRRCRACDAR